jgi:hypothetical protein
MQIVAATFLCALELGIGIAIGHKGTSSDGPCKVAGLARLGTAKITANTLGAVIALALTGRGAHHAILFEATRAPGANGGRDTVRVAGASRLARTQSTNEVSAG